MAQYIIVKLVIGRNWDLWEITDVSRELKLNSCQSVTRRQTDWLSAYQVTTQFKHLLTPHNASRGSHVTRDVMPSITDR